MAALADLVFVFFLGVGTFFSPCALALVPSYLAYFAGRTTGDSTSRHAAVDGLRVGLAASGGILATFAVLAVGLYAIRSYVDVATSLLVNSFASLGLLVGVTFIVLGALMAMGRSPGFTLRTKAPQGRTPRAMVVWGILFAAGSMACSLPLALAFLMRVLADPLSGPLLILAYGAGLGGILLILSPILALLEGRASGWLTRSARKIQIGSGVALAVAGAYVVLYYAGNFQL
jgi:cytochrome c-type biogenesis protein